MKKLIAFIFGLLISLSFYADARLVSGTAQHQHDSATGGGTNINGASLGSNTKIAPSIYAYDSAAPTNEKYYKFGNASGDFVLFTYDDTPAVASTVFSITRTGTTPNSFDLGAVSLTSSKPCASGYTRVTPNFCRVNADGAGVSLTRDACTTITAPSSDSKAILFRIDLQVISANAVANRFARVQTYTSNACAAGDNIYRVYHELREWNATAATTMGFLTVDLLSPYSGNAFLKMDDDGGNSSVAFYYIIGYFD